MSENNIDKNLDSISKSLGNIDFNLSMIANKPDDNGFGIGKHKNVVIDAFPDGNNWNNINGSSILKTEIINFPQPAKKDKEYLIFNTSTITNQVRLKLLLLSLLGFLYSIYDIEISTLFGTTLKDDNNNLPSVLFTLILIEFLFFLSVYYRDLKKHSVEKKHITNKDLSNIKDIEKELKVIQGKNILKLIEQYLSDKGMSQEFIDKIKKEFKYSKNANFSDIINFSEAESKLITDILDEYINNSDEKEGLKKIKELVGMESTNRELLSDTEYKLSYTKEEKGELDLELFNKNYIFIIFKGLYPIFLALLSLYFLYTYDKLNIQLLNNFYKGVGGWAGILFLCILISLGYKIINNILKTNK